MLEDVGLHLADENWLEALIKFLAAFVLSGTIGLERQRKGRAAGLRTHVLVCLGATLLMIVSEYIARADSTAVVNLDRARIAAGIITGIGFLGAGTIMKSGQEKVGLTTAAMVWFAAAQGVAVGAGYLLVATIATLVALAVVTGLSSFENRLPQPARFILSLQLPLETANTGKIREQLAAVGNLDVQVAAVRSSEQKGTLILTYHVYSKNSRDFHRLEELLRTHYAPDHKISLDRLQL